MLEQVKKLFSQIRLGRVCKEKSSDRGKWKLILGFLNLSQKCSEEANRFVLLFLFLSCVPSILVKARFTALD
mgnify:CR=1 FL=1